MNDNFPIDLDNPLSDLQFEQEEEIPVWKVLTILCASIVLIFGTGILVGTELQEPCAVAQAPARGKAISAKLEAMKRPIQLASETAMLATVWAKISDERVHSPLGEKQ